MDSSRVLILMSALRSVGQQRALALAQLNAETAVMVVWHTRALVMFASNSTDSGNESCSLLGAMPLLGATQRETQKKKKNQRSFKACLPNFRNSCV